MNKLTEDEVARIAIDVLSEWLPGYVDRLDGSQIQFRQIVGGDWAVDPADGIRAKGELGFFRVTVKVERVPDE